ADCSGRCGCRVQPISVAVSPPRCQTVPFQIGLISANNPGTIKLAPLRFAPMSQRGPSRYWLLAILISPAVAIRPGGTELGKTARAADEAPPDSTAPAVVQPIGPGDHVVRLTVDNRPRSYRVHVPPQYDAAKPTPVVLAFHGSSMNGKMMASFSGL